MSEKGCDCGPDEHCQGFCVRNGKGDIIEEERNGLLTGQSGPSFGANRKCCRWIEAQTMLFGSSRQIFAFLGSALSSKASDPRYCDFRNHPHQIYLCVA